jgi:hypothetical protein
VRQKNLTALLSHCTVLVSAFVVIIGRLYGVYQFWYELPDVWRSPTRRGVPARCGVVAWYPKITIVSDCDIVKDARIAVTFADAI